jgi:hypothetical protein
MLQNSGIILQFSDDANLKSWLSALEKAIDPSNTHYKGTLTKQGSSFPYSWKVSMFVSV